MAKSATVVSVDFPGMLKHLTQLDGWTEAEGPDSGVGLDYWYQREDEGGVATAYINLDQTSLTVEITSDDPEASEPLWTLALDTDELEGTGYQSFVTQDTCPSGP